MSRKLLQQALDALRISAPLGHAVEDYEYRHKVIKDIEAELAKPEQEELIQFKDGKWSYVKKPWVGLTDEELSEIYNVTAEELSEIYDDFCTQHPEGDVNIADFILIARALESKLKEKNT